MISLCLIIYTNVDDLFNYRSLRMRLVKYFKDNLESSKLHKMLNLDDKLNDKEYIDRIQDRLEELNTEYHNFVRFDEPTYGERIQIVSIYCFLMNLPMG